MVRLRLGRSDRSGKQTRWGSFLQKRRAEKDGTRDAVQSRSTACDGVIQSPPGPPRSKPDGDEVLAPPKTDVGKSDIEQAPSSSDQPVQIRDLSSPHQTGGDLSRSDADTAWNLPTPESSTPSWQKSLKTWRQTKRFYRRGNQWLYRCSASKDHLRGSGFYFPAGAADAVKAPPGEITRFHNEVSDVRLYRNRKQPQLGSIRRLALEAGLHEGDEFFIVFESGQIYLEQVAKSNGSSSLARAAALAGSPGEGSEDELLACLANAVGAASGSEARLLYEIYLDRGDDDIAQSLLESGIDTPVGEDEQRTGTSVDEEIDRIMELLR